MELGSEERLPLTEPVVDPTEQHDVLDRLRAKREELSQQSETLIPVAGYEEPKLLLQYKLMTGPELNAIGKRVSRQVKDEYSRGITAALDVMVSACIGIYIDKGDGTPPEPLTINGEPAAISDPDFASRLEIDAGDPPTARAVMRGLFNNNDIAIGQHSFRLQRWMADTSSDVDGELFGPGL